MDKSVFRPPKVSTPVLRPLLQDQDQQAVNLQEDDEAVLAGEEDVHVTDDSVPGDDNLSLDINIIFSPQYESQSETDEGNIL